MRTDRENPAAMDCPPGRIDRVIECLMAALLAFMPLAFGAVEAWAEEVVLAVAGAMILCLLLKVVLRPRGSLVWTWAYVPLGLFLLLAAGQLVPLPSGVLAAVTPNTAALKASLAGGLSRAAPSGAGMTVSFYPLATARALRLALAVSVVFVVAVNVYRRDSQIKRVLTVVVVVGGGVALLALAQIVTGTQKIYWRVPAPVAGGPFVNRNNYCPFMSLSVGAALGLLLLRLKGGFREAPVALSRVVERLTARPMRPVWYLAGVIVLGAASVFLSLSRGGMVSLLVAWAVTIAVLALRRRLGAWGWVMCVLAVGALVCVLYVGFDSVYDRLASLRHADVYQGRWQLARDSARVWARFPLLGAGLGTHEWVYPMFDRSTIPATATHVENEYVQTAEETGIVGLALVVAFGVIVLRDYLRCVRRGRRGIGIAAVGLGAGLLAVLVHSAVDFGLHLPATACLAALFGALVVSMARADRPRTPSGGRRRAPVARALAAVCLAACAAVWAWAAIEADAARRGQGYWRQVQRLEKQMRRQGWAVANADYARLLALAGKAVRCQPGNVRYRHWLNAHRWRAVSRVADAGTGDAVLGRAALASARRIAADLERAHAACPTFGPSYSLAGQLRRFVLGDPAGGELIRRGRALAPCDPVACLADGALSAREGDAAAARAAFRRALALDGRCFGRVVALCVFDLARPDLAVEIARDDRGRLAAVAEVLRQAGHTRLAAGAGARAAAMLRAECDSPDASPRALARAAETCFQSKDFVRAAAYYRRAVSGECGNVPWRLNYARALAAAGRVSEARRQARIGLKLSGGTPEAKRLVADLSVRPAGDGDDI